jgi:hypothetical protein
LEADEAPSPAWTARQASLLYGDIRIEKGASVVRRNGRRKGNRRTLTGTAARAADQTSSAPATQLTTSTAHTTVAASGGSPTTSREPPGQPAAAIDADHAATNGKPAGPRNPAAAKAARPAARFAAVSMATRIPELAKWIAARPAFTFADAAAANAPSPCSLTVMAYTLPDARLTSALAELGYVVTAGGKNGHTVTAIKAPANPTATRAAMTPAVP